MLLSAGLPVPDTILVHGYLNANGTKLAKSGDVHVDPGAAARSVGVDGLRYWLLRAVGRGGDADWVEAKALELRTTELANELGNLVQRTLRMIQLYRGGVIPRPCDHGELSLRTRSLPSDVSAAIGEDLDPQRALLAIWELVRAANRYVAGATPWRLAREGREQELDRVLFTLADCLRAIADALHPYLPNTARRIVGQLGGGEVAPLFPRAP